MSRSDAEREAGRRAVEFENKIIQHRQLRDAVTELDSLRGRYNPHKQQEIKARALFVVGDSGSGKSTLFEDFYQRMRNTPDLFRSTDDGDIRPVIHIKEPDGSGKREFVKGILRSLGYPAPDRLRAGDIIGEIATICQRMQVELILVDEAHELVKGKGEDNAEHTREFVKKLLNRTHTQFAFAGVPDLLDLQLTNQMDRRSVPIVRFDPYDWGDIDGRSNFHLVLSKMEEYSGLKFEEPLHGEFMSPRMYYATRGLIGLASRLVSRLIIVAAREKLSKVGVANLASVWHSFTPVKRVAIQTASFKLPPVKRRLVVPSAGNPFLADDDELDRLWGLWASSAKGKQPYPGMTAAQVIALDLEKKAGDETGKPTKVTPACKSGFRSTVASGSGIVDDPFARRGDFEP